MRRPAIIFASLAALLVCALIAALSLRDGPASAEIAIGSPPTQQQRDAIENWLARYLVLPETTMWRFEPVKPYVGRQILVCGRLNFQSASRRYVGFRRFYAILEDGRVTLAQIEDLLGDPSGRLEEKIVYLCGKS